MTMLVETGLVVNFVLNGKTPLLMKWDNVEEADDLKRWRDDPENRKASVAGDDRSPPWTWQSCLYNDGTHVAMPSENLMAGLRAAGAKIYVPKAPGVRAGETFKKMSQSGLIITSDYCRFSADGRQFAMADIHKIKGLPFAEQKQRVQAFGFDLSVKRAAVERKKHVRVRPKFDAWQIDGVIHVSEPMITFDILTRMFDLFGRLVGLCDWRPGSKDSPGPYGMFAAELKQVKR